MMCALAARRDRVWRQRRQRVGDLQLVDTERGAGEQLRAARERTRRGQRIADRKRSLYDNARRRGMSQWLDCIRVSDIAVQHWSPRAFEMAYLHPRARFTMRRTSPEVAQTF